MDTELTDENKAALAAEVAAKLAEEEAEAAAAAEEAAKLAAAKAAKAAEIALEKAKKEVEAKISRTTEIQIELHWSHREEIKRHSENLVSDLLALGELSDVEGFRLAIDSHLADLEKALVEHKARWAEISAKLSRCWGWLGATIVYVRSLPPDQVLGLARAQGWVRPKWAAKDHAPIARSKGNRERNRRRRGVEAKSLFAKTA